MPYRRPIRTLFAAFLHMFARGQTGGMATLAKSFYSRTNGRLTMKSISRYLAAFLIAAISSITSLYAASVSERHPSAEHLIRSVIFSRHGVRAPTQSPAKLASWADKPWPVWPVSPGELTPRGYELVLAQWQALKPELSRYALLPENGCPEPEHYSLIADKDQRTIRTAMAISEGLFPNCGIKPQHGNRYDRLFHPDRAAYRKIDRQAALEQVNDRLQALENDAAITSAIGRIQEITGCCSLPSLQKQNIPLEKLATTLSIDSANARLVMNGKWPIASALAEIMLLEYGQWPGKNAGWGQADQAVLQEIVPLHDRIFDAIHRAPILAKAGSSDLLRHIRDTLLSDASPALSILVGHDTNIAAIGGLLGIDWNLPGQGTNSIFPGSFIHFGLWQKADGSHEVRIDYHAPTYRTLHSAPAPVVIPEHVIIGKPAYTPEAFSQAVDDACAP